MGNQEQPFSERREMHKPWFKPQGLFKEMIFAEYDDWEAIIVSTQPKSQQRIEALEHHHHSFFAHGEF